MKSRLITGFVAFLAMALSGVASADVIDWTDWQEIGGTSGVGVIGSVGVRYSGPLTFGQTGGPCTNYWTEGDPAPYTGNSTVDNAPTACEMIALDIAGTHTITFSEAVLDPIMAIVSLGRPNQDFWVTYAFDQAFSVLSEGRGYWGDGTYSTSGNSLTGQELHAAIQFSGAVESITWRSSPNEYWHGITVGVPSSVPAPGTLALLGLGLVGMAARRRKTV